MAKIKLKKEKEVFVIHYNDEPLHFVKSKWNEWTPSKKIYFTKGAAKSGLRYIPELIRENCTIVKYTPE